MANTVSKYFLGEMTLSGFKTSFDKQISSDGFYTYILKGGPGTGKSSLMKKIALNFSDVDDLDLYYCSSDPVSLDAVVLKKAKAAIVDGTSPHVFDTNYPVILQTIVNLGECWNKEELIQNKQEIKQITDDCSTWHIRFKKYITAFSSINSDIYTIAKSGVLFDKLDRFIGRISKKCLPKTASGDGQLYYKKLSSLTKEGYFTMPTENYENTFVLSDPYFAGSDYFLQSIAEIAVSRGYSVIASECSLFLDNTYEHILIPELKLAFISSNYINEIDLQDANMINFLRFYENDKLKCKKNRLDFSKKAALELKNEAVSSLINAKKLHDKLETYYISAIDFKKINAITEALASEIAKKYK